MTRDDRNRSPGRSRSDLLRRRRMWRSFERRRRTCDAERLVWSARSAARAGRARGRAGVRSARRDALEREGLALHARDQRRGEEGAARTACEGSRAAEDELDTARQERALRAW